MADIELKHAATGFVQELIYGLLLLTSFLLGFAYTKVPAGPPRRILAGLTGFILVFLTSGRQTVHSFVPVVLAWAWIRLLKIKAQWSVFWTTLVYLFFFRIAHGWMPAYFAQNSPFANAVQLLTTLRIISYGFEHSSEQSFTSFLDFWCYNYCFIGLFSGPFYRKCVFDDYCDNENLDRIPVKQHIINKLKYLPIPMVLYFALKSYMPVEYYRSEEYLSNPAWVNVFTLQIQFAWCRYRFYTAWIMAEAVCMSSRLGAYPVEREARPGLGPKKAEAEPTSETKEYNFNAVYNIKCMVTEFEPSLRQCMRDWNTSVQWWLANYTYKKLQAPIFFRICFTMFISAYWHGIAPGYFMGFLCVPMLTAVEDLIKRAWRRSHPSICTTLMYIQKMISFSMTGMAFLLLDFQAVYNCWKAAGFAIFVVNFAIAALSLGKVMMTGASQPKKEVKSE